MVPLMLLATASQAEFDRSSSGRMMTWLRTPTRPFSRRQPKNVRSEWPFFFATALPFFFLDFFAISLTLSVRVPGATRSGALQNRDPGWKKAFVPGLASLARDTSRHYHQRFVFTLWTWTCSPLPILALAMPMSWPYFQTVSPFLMSVSATLWPIGTSIFDFSLKDALSWVPT